MTKTVSARPKNRHSRFPFAPLVTHPFSSLDHWLERFFHDQDGVVSDAGSALMDVAETDQAFEITMDLPGFKADDVDIQIDNNTLTIRATREENREEQSKDKQFHRMERFCGSVSRSVVLPHSLNEAEAVAEVREGVLTVVVPKLEEAKPRKISVRS